MFITIDGPDGAGKTTALQVLCGRLRQKYSVHLTVEPTHTPLGYQIRRILQSGTPEERKTLTDLFLQDRANHVEKEILPKLAEGKTVLCDRYKYSTVVYQQLQGEPRDLLIARNRDFPVPDIAFILTAAHADLLLERIAVRGKGPEMFETKAVLEQILGLYAQMKDCFPSENLIFLDASSPPETIAEEMLQAIEILSPAP